MQRWPEHVGFVTGVSFPSICEVAEDMSAPFWRKKIVFLFTGDTVFLLTDDFTVISSHMGSRSNNAISLKNVPCC